MNLTQSQSQASILQELLFLQIRSLMNVNKSITQQNFQSYSIFNNNQSIQFKRFVSNQYQMIFKQNQVLDQIKNQIIKKKSSNNNQIIFCGSNTNNLDILPMESSFDMSNISSVQGDQEIFKTKFGQQFQKSLIASALKEVQQNCLSQTYQTIKNCVLNNKQKQYESLSQKLQKITKRNQQLETSFIIKSSQLSQTQTQLKQALQKLQVIEQQKRKIKLKSNQLSQKQKRIFKMENSIIFKQKLFHQGKKRYERQKNLFLNIENRLNQLYKQMHGLWDNIILKMEQSDKITCSNKCNVESQSYPSCWKKQVMKKCKQQLMDQRNLLKQEQEQIQKQFQMMQVLSDQVRKLVNQKQNSSTLDPFTTQPSGISL